MTLDKKDGPSWRDQMAEAGLTLTFIVTHTIIMSVFVVAGYLLQWLLIALGDPKLFDWAPWRYVIDTMDLGTLALLASNIIRLIRQMGRKK